MEGLRWIKRPIEAKTISDKSLDSSAQAIHSGNKNKNYDNHKSKGSPRMGPPDSLVTAATRWWRHLAQGPPTGAARGLWASAALSNWEALAASRCHRNLFAATIPLSLRIDNRDTLGSPGN